MPTNLHAAIRYNIIDQCLRERDQQNSWKRLAIRCVELLTEQGVNINEPARRTILGDIQAMRSGILGYEAPIAYSKEKGYYYSDKKFSIHKSSVPLAVLEDLQQMVISYKMITGSSNLSSLVNTINILQEKLNLYLNKKADPIIYFEHSPNEKGQRWLDDIYNAIKMHTSLLIKYQPFDGDEKLHTISPLIIKEYNNRWYVFGFSFDFNKIINLSLDRIEKCSPSIHAYHYPDDFSYDNYFRHLFGVTKPENARPKIFTIKVSALLKKYIETKPIHSSLEWVSENKTHAIFTLEIYDNYEIRSHLRCFGEDLVIKSVK